jgi:hypothetical protein
MIRNKTFFIVGLLILLLSIFSGYAAYKAQNGAGLFLALFFGEQFSSNVANIIGLFAIAVFIVGMYLIFMGFRNSKGNK